MGTKIKILAALIEICGTLPIWFYLLYQILLRVGASELMWFLFWCYLPMHIFVGFIHGLLRRDED